MMRQRKKRRSTGREETKVKGSRWILNKNRRIVSRMVGRWEERKAKQKGGKRKKRGSYEQAM